MEHPIHDLLKISLDNIKQMIDVDTIVGRAVTGQNGQIIIPVSKVKFGFATGGTDMTNHMGKNSKDINSTEISKTPFGGGTGGTVSITPTAFLVLNEGEVDVLTLNDEAHLYEKLIDKVPEVIANVKGFLNKEKETVIEINE